MKSLQNRLERYSLNMNIALQAVLDNTMRSILTALGIIFGVAAVIAMLAIGNGAKKEVLDQMKLVGVNNIIITPIVEDQSADAFSESESDNEDNSKSSLSPGLRVIEAESIKDVIPTVDHVCSMVNYKLELIAGEHSHRSTFSGISKGFFDLYNLKVEDGSLFSDLNYKSGDKVCVIGSSVKARLFPTEDAVGKYVKCGKIWLKIIGVLEKRFAGEADMSGLFVDNYDNSVYAPLQTVLLRYNDRSKITKWMMRSRDDDKKITNRNQLDKIVVQVKESKDIKTTADAIQKMLFRKHAGIEDFQITIPEVLLENERKNREMFNLVLGAIASISLIVGGIGIMNIMLASVMERIKEIGLRRSLGATKHDVVFQFITEATIISLIGGILGIVLGVTLAVVISYFFEISTIISWFSIFISFFVSAGVGIIFGYMPAKKAAEQDPVNSLRHE
jgi:putative ABC transport system permease protein